MYLKNAYGCWVDVFELSRYRGRRRRLFGPSVLTAVRARTPAWGINIDSIIVGPEAFVRLFHQRDPLQTTLWLHPRQLIEDLTAGPSDDGIDSLEILVAAPRPGDPGYSSFQAQLQEDDAHE